MVRVRVRGFVRIVITLRAQKTISPLYYQMLTTFSTGNELKCCMGLTLLSEGLTGFWLCESLDSLSTVYF